MAFFNCQARLNAAAGRKLSDAEMSAIFERINKAANDIKAGRRTPPAGRTGVDGVVDAVAQEAASERVAEAERKQQNAALQVVKLSQRVDSIKAMKAAGLTDLDALSRTIANRADGRANQFSLENRHIGVFDSLRRGLQDTWDALGRDWLGFVQDKDKIRLLIREMRGEDTGDAMAKRGAQAWLATAEEARSRFNAAGGEIGKIEDWGLPQHHSQELVARAGKQSWIDTILPALDRSKYTDDAGVAWSEPQLRDFLGHAWETIATNGYANITPGEFKGSGAVANRHAETRQIHFKDADSYINYWQKFGEKTFPEILMGHIDSMAKDIAFVEHFGPNPDAAYRTLRDMALKDQATADPTKTEKARGQAVKVDALYDVAAGRTQPVADSRVAHVFDVMRNLNVAGKLGSAFWASFFGDKVMMETMNRLNDLPAMQGWYNELRMLNPANPGERRMLQRQGLMLDYMRNAMSRWGGELGDSSFTGKLAGAVMRVSGMNAINEWRRGAFGLTLMDSLGHLVSTTDFAKIDPTDTHLMQSYGIDVRDFGIWKLAQLEDYGHGNATMLTPDAISRIPTAALQAALPSEFGGALGVSAKEAEAIAQGIRRDSVTKLLGAINSESRLAIVEPGWRERAQIMSKNPRGTWQGELSRAFWQFKSFPLAQFERMWDVSQSRPTFGGKIGVLSAVMAMQTLAGAMIMQTRDMIAGKDPRPMDWKFGLSSFMQGGALGIYGDFLYGINQTRYGTGPLEIAAGPTIGSALDLMTSTMNAGKDASEGKQTHLAAKLMTVGKGFIPTNNLWYTKAATDHLIFQNIQEALSPGYLANMRSNTQRQYGQGWWWEPGDMGPSRAPDLTNATRQ